MPDPICVAFPTIQDGTVLRWYADEHGYANGRELVSASRNGVLVHVYLEEIPDGVLEQAKQAHETLRSPDPGKARDLATHRTAGILSRGLVPIERDQAG